MKILRNYILKDFFSAFIFSLLIFSMVMLLGNLMKISDMVIRKGINILDALRIFSFFLPYLLGFTLPLAFLLGVLLAMGRLVADNEIVAIRVAGISLLKILRIFLLLGVVFSLFLFILNDKIIPHFHYRYRSQIKNIYSKNITALIEPGIFLENFRDHILYVADKEGNKLKNIFIYEVDEKEGVTKVTFAKRGEFIAEQNTIKMKLEEGFRDEVNTEKRKEFYRLNFKIFFMDIPIEEKKQVSVEKKPSDMRLDELKDKIQHLKSMGINPIELIAEFHKRISFSLSIITFILLGFGASLVVRHREKSINFGIAFFTAGIYYLLFILGETLIEHRMITPSLGMWLPNIIIGSLGGYLFYRNAYLR
ncbi:MAG: LptF/LptG family permease [Candidatus Omnitrophota bacterium]|nr:MAG: LptF/LptG family permease [Candidatus Omnitrophota bacterium]